MEDVLSLVMARQRPRERLLYGPIEPPLQPLEVALQVQMELAGTEDPIARPMIDAQIGGAIQARPAVAL